jgi:hypothetical protein
MFDCLFADAAEVGPAELHQGIAFEGIELQVDFEVFLHLRKALYEIFFLGNADAIGVDHQVPDRASLGHLHDLEKVWVNGELATGELDYVGMTFVAHYRVQYLFDLI